MKRRLEFVRTTMRGGLLFIVPLILLIAVLHHGVVLLRPVVVPLAAHFPEHRIAGVGVTTLLGIALILILSFVVGLIGRTAAGRRCREWLDWAFLGRVPGYTILKSALGSTGSETEEVAVVLVRIEDAWQLGLLMEAHEDGHRTVYVPGAPNPASGSIYYLTEDRVRPAGIPMRSAFAAIRRLGVGSKDLLKGKLS